MGHQVIEAEHERSMRLAWTMEALHRQERLPKLETLLGRKRQQPQTLQEQRLMLTVLSEQYGIPLRSGARG